MGIDTQTKVFRLSRTAYLTVVFLLMCALPLAFGTDGPSGVVDAVDGGGNGITGFTLSWRVVFLLVPVLGAVFIARTATIVGEEGIRVRALFGSRLMPWQSVRGLDVEQRSVYAVLEDGGAVRLPCIRIANLHDVAEASGGRLPEIPRPKVIPAPHKRR